MSKDFDKLFVGYFVHNRLHQLLLKDWADKATKTFPAIELDWSDELKRKISNLVFTGSEDHDS